MLIQEKRLINIEYDNTSKNKLIEDLWQRLSGSKYITVTLHVGFLAGKTKYQLSQRVEKELTKPQLCEFLSTVPDEIGKTIVIGFVTISERHCED